MSEPRTEDQATVDQTSPFPADRARPSSYGAALGKHLAGIAQAGYAMRDDLPPMCSTCAFREGCMTNQMGETALVAFKCAIGADPDRFACHHGMKDGQPVRLCAGYLAAKCAPWDAVKAASHAMTLIDVNAPDTVRQAFDAWAAMVDPENRLDDYQRGRLYLKAVADEARPAQTADYSPGITPNPLEEGRE